jgi:hypothetical protein
MSTRMLLLIPCLTACGEAAPSPDAWTAISSNCAVKIGNCGGVAIADIEGRGVVGILEGVDTLADAFVEIYDQSNRRAKMSIELDEDAGLWVVPQSGDAALVDHWELSLTIDASGGGNMTGWLVDEHDDAMPVVGDFGYAETSEGLQFEGTIELPGSSGFYGNEAGAAGTRLSYINSQELWD